MAVAKTAVTKSLLEVGKLMCHDIVDDRLSRLHQAPVEANLALGVAAPPARTRAGDEYLGRHNP